LYDSIVNIGSKPQLNEYNRKVIELQNSIDINSLAKYDQKILITKVENLKKLLLLKQEELTTERFEFNGDPIRPNDSNVAITRPSIGPIQANVESNQHCDLERTTTTIGGNHVLVNNITECIVVGRAKSVNLAHAQFSIIQIGSEGPIFVHDVDYCVLQLTCHQLRLRNVVNCIVIQKVASGRVIIEDCSNISLGTQTNDQIVVDDFNWPSTATNPHYCELSLEETSAILRCVEVNAKTGKIDLIELKQLLKNSTEFSE
jgi:hypothetical protein